MQSATRGSPSNAVERHRTRSKYLASRRGSLHTLGSQKLDVFARPARFVYPNPSDPVRMNDLQFPVPSVAVQLDSTERPTKKGRTDDGHVGIVYPGVYSMFHLVHQRR